MSATPNHDSVRRLGSLTLTRVTDGQFRLDGGAMFGVVPKVLWQKQQPADDKNRILMDTNSLLIESGSDLVLVDTGIGRKHSDKFLEIHTVDPEGPTLLDSIAAAGYQLGDITHVVLSHLHFDHCGWNAVEENGRMVPTFPRARYWLSRGEVEHARNPSERDGASYLPVNWEPLFEAGVVELFDDRAQPATGVEVVEAPGHNADMCVVTLNGGSQDQGDDGKGIFWADLIPTRAHIPYPWIMGYDLYPMTTLESKKMWIPRAAEEGWLGFFQHDAYQPWARIEETASGRYRPVAVEE